MFRSPYPDEVIPNVSVYDFLFRDLSADDAARVALIDGPTGDETSYGALKAQIDLLAGALAARGIGIGDVVALHSPNVPAFATVFHGILRSGATATTVNALYTVEEMARQLQDSRATMLFTVSPLITVASESAAFAGIPDERIIVLDGLDGYTGLRDLLAEGAPAPEVSFDPATHVAVIPYSSGTTGFAKGVQLSHTNLVANVAQCAPVLDVSDEDRILAFLPFFHIYGMTILLNLALSRHAALITLPRFDLAQFLQVIQDQKVSFVFIAPPVAVALAKHPLVDQFDLSSVRGMMSGAAPMDESLANAVTARLGVHMQQGYGMSELSPVSHVIPPDRDDLSRGTIGFPIANIECKIVDVETGAELDMPAEGSSRPGELWVRGPNVMLGYLGQEQATHETVDDDGFLHTGDIAQVNHDGSFQIVDRLKELIKYKGYQVAPAELEALLLTHPEIADAAVVAQPDPAAGEIPKAFVVRREGSALTEGDVMTFVAEHVAPHKKVRAVAFIDAVPKSSAGKILRKDLRGR
ncbi:AMP-binding protein [Lysinimonas soli]|uniref:AMP-binding protein n=1 Tax=Lysinimonas soli TaxID=1074233 RepID=A0ABW0NLI0_9MICO